MVAGLRKRPRLSGPIEKLLQTASVEKRGTAAEAASSAACHTFEKRVAPTGSARTSTASL